MEWFGLTYYGFPEPIKDMVRSDYVEPGRPENLLEPKGPLRKPFFDLISELDCYLGRVDGYAYKSSDRLLRMRKKGVVKPVGPIDIYKCPSTSTTEIGWWTSDPALLEQKWYLPRTRYPQPVSEKTKFVSYALQIDKLFRL